MNTFKQRRDRETTDQTAGLGRRATDNSLRGLHVDEADGEEAWQSWEKALKQQELDSTPTQPVPLE